MVLQTMNKIVLANGMPRSGSTWLYNAARHILNQVVSKNDFVYGWHSDIKSRKKVTLLKVHGINQKLLNESSIVLYSYRDIRDVLASRFRMWEMPPTMGVVHNLIYESRFFDDRADYIMKYEDFIEDQRKIVEELDSVLDAHSNIDKVMELLSKDKKPASDGKSYNKEELYHTGHVTNGKHMSFEDAVPDSIIKKTEELYGQWFIDHGYDLVSL